MKYIYVNFETKEVSVSSKKQIPGFENVGSIDHNGSFRPNTGFGQKISITTEKMQFLIKKFMTLYKNAGCHRMYDSISDDELGITIPPENKYSKSKYAAERETVINKYINTHTFSHICDTLNNRTIADILFKSIKSSVLPTLKHAGWKMLYDKLQLLVSGEFANKKVTEKNVELLLTSAFNSAFGNIQESKINILRSMIREEIIKIRKGK